MSFSRNFCDFLGEFVVWLLLPLFSGNKKRRKSGVAFPMGLGLTGRSSNDGVGKVFTLEGGLLLFEYHYHSGMRWGVSLFFRLHI